MKIGQAEKVKGVGGVFRNGVADSLCQNGLKEGAIRSIRIACLRLVGDVRDRRLTVTEHVGPLLDLFPEILRI